MELGLGYDIPSHFYGSVEGKINFAIDVRRAASLKRFVDIIQNFKIDASTDNLAKFASLKPVKTIMLPSDLKKAIHEIDWKASPTQVNLPSNSQVFGKLIYEAGIEGIIYNSAKANGSCMALFPNNFRRSESVVKVTGELPATVQVTELNKHTWDKLI